MDLAALVDLLAAAIAAAIQENRDRIAALEAAL